MFVNARKKIDQAVAKYTFFNVIPVNAITEPYLQYMLDIGAKEGTRVKAPINYEIMNKYQRRKCYKTTITA